jgi:hypothetical protein
VVLVPLDSQPVRHGKNQVPVLLDLSVLGFQSVGPLRLGLSLAP